MHDELTRNTQKGQRERERVLLLLDDTVGGRVTSPNLIAISHKGSEISISTCPFRVTMSECTKLKVQQNVRLPPFVRVMQETKPELLASFKITVKKRFYKIT